MANQNQKQFSDELNQEVSSIKPDLGTGQKERKEPGSLIQLPNTIPMSRMDLVLLT